MLVTVFCVFGLGLVFWLPLLASCDCCGFRLSLCLIFVLLVALGLFFCLLVVGFYCGFSLRVVFLLRFSDLLGCSLSLRVLFDSQDLIWISSYFWVCFECS